MGLATLAENSVDNVLETVDSACGAASCALTQNVGDTERIFSIIAGGAIGLFGLQQGGFRGLAIAAIGGSFLYRGFTGHCHLYGALGTSTNRRHDSATAVPAQLGVKHEQSLTINRTASELYDRWRNLAELPRIMRQLESVTETGDNRSHWVAKGPMGMRLEWDAEIINAEPGRLLAWRSLPGSQVDTAGSVHFEEGPKGRGTRLRVSLKYNPPGGRLGAGLAWLFGSSAEQEIDSDLRRFKQLMETGEFTTTAGQPTGRGRTPVSGL